jgi:hypothetical protein
MLSYAAALLIGGLGAAGAGMIIGRVIFS